MRGLGYSILEEVREEGIQIAIHISKLVDYL